MKVNNQIDQARWLAILIATGIGIYLCWLMLKPFVGVLEWAIVLTIVFHPVHKRLAKKINRPRLSALVSCLLVIVIVVLPFGLVMLAVVRELGNVVPNLPQRISEVVHNQTPIIGKASEWLQTRFGIDALSSHDFLLQQLKRSGEVLLGVSWNLVGNLVGVTIKSFFVVFTMYYLFRDGERIVKRLPSALPVSAAQGEAIMNRTQEVVSASVYGIVTIAALQGLLGGIAFWLLGVPSPILWAVLMSFVCMIPIAGSFMVWLPLSLFLILTGHWAKGIFLIAWGAFVVSTIDNFLRPKLIRNQTKLHELFVFFSVLGGMSVFGILGIVLGPVVLAITLGLLQTFKPHSPVSTMSDSAFAAPLR